MAKASKFPDEEETHFINVDLDIISRVPLELLVSAFGPKVFVLHVGREGRRYGAHLELVGSQWTDRDADRIIRAMIALVSKLLRPARKLWDQAQSRDFNIGIQAGFRPHSHELTLKTDTLEQVARVGARIVVTIYGAELAAAQNVRGSRTKRMPPNNQMQQTRPTRPTEPRR